MANTLISERGHLVLPVSARITHSAVMQRYFVDVRIAGSHVAEVEGGCATLDAAQHAATRLYDHWVAVIGRVWDQALRSAVAA